MNRRVWTGVFAGVLAALLLLGVAGGAYRAGERHDVVTRTVGNGEVVRVVGDYGWGYGHGGGFFFLFPLLAILLVFLLLRSRRAGWYGGPGRYWGGGYGGYGGYGACGPGQGQGQGNSFEEQHRRAHEDAPPRPTEPAEA
jgi:hypothetical protein